MDINTVRTVVTLIALFSFFFGIALGIREGRDWERKFPTTQTSKAEKKGRNRRDRITLVQYSMFANRSSAEITFRKTTKYGRPVTRTYYMTQHSELALWWLQQVLDEKPANTPTIRADFIINSWSPE